MQDLQSVAEQGCVATDEVEALDSHVGKARASVEAGAYADAVKAFETAAQYAKSLLADRTPLVGKLSELANLEAEAGAAREKALSMGAEQADSELYARAEARRAAAQRAHAACDASSAEGAFEEAAALFNEAASKGQKVLVDARSVASRAETARAQLVEAGRCADLLPRAKRDGCSRGETLLKKGKDAMARPDAAGAIAHFTEAEHEFANARQIAAAAPPPPPIVKNSKPTLQLSGKRAGDVGSTVILHADARDPDNDAVTVDWRIVQPDQTVAQARGERLSLVLSKAGSYRIEAVARDAKGASAMQEATVRSVAPPVAASPKPVPPEPKLAAVAARPPKIDPDATAAAVLRRYEQAYESRDLGELRRVYQMTEKQSEQMGAFFGATSSVDLQVEPKSTRMEGDTIVVDFEQVMKARGVRTPNRAVALRATLTRTGASSEWVIQKIAGR